jgi:hypothetical protein
VSKRVVRYEGRHPVHADEGGSSAASNDPMAAYGRLSVAGFRGDVAETPTGGAGPIERRKATPEELAAARAREAKPTHLVAVGGGIARPAPVTTNAALTQQSRQRGAEANRARIAASRPSPVQEEPVSEAEQDIPGIIPDELPFQTPELITPCSSCVHEPVCAIRMTLDPLAFRLVTVEDLDEALTVRTPNVVIDCRHYLAQAVQMIAVAVPPRAKKATRAAKPKAEPEAKAEPATGGGPAPMQPFLRRMLDALVEADGDRTAAATKLGIKRTSLIGTLGKLRSRGDLTEQERAAISSARA